MIRTKTPKELEDLDDLIGKSIVDPNGDIIAKCIGVFEDDKKKPHMKISIKTEINSEFAVEETIPVSLINKVGEVILLKRSVNIKPIAVEDIIKIEILDEVENQEEKKDDKSAVQSSDKESKDEGKAKKKNIKKEVENKTEQKKKKVQKKSKISSSKSNKKTAKINFDTAFDDIINEEDINIKENLISNIVYEIKTRKRLRKEVKNSLFKKLQTTDHSIRLVSSEIFKRICEESTELAVPMFLDGLKASYNEPSFEIEENLTTSLNSVASDNNNGLLKNNFTKFFTDLFVQRAFCKSITLNRIHNINLKVFINNFQVQELIIKIFLQRISEKCKDAKEFANFLKDYNAIIIAYTILNQFDVEFWKKIRKTKIIQSEIDEAFIHSIERIMDYYNKGNIQKITEIMDPKIGIYITNKLLTQMVKEGIQEVFSNVSSLPLDVLCDFYSDDNNRIVQIVFDLINKKEINAEVLFVENKTFISILDN